MSQHWERDPKTGDYVIDKGVPVQTESLRIAAFHRYKTQRLRWLYAPDTQYGSDFHLILKNRTTSDPTNFENIGGRALQPIIDDGRANRIDVELKQTSRNAVCLSTRIFSQRSDDPEELVINPVGGR